MTPLEIEPATFRLVAQCLNQVRHRVPPKVYGFWSHVQKQAPDDVAVARFMPLRSSLELPCCRTVHSSADPDG